MFRIQKKLNDEAAGVMVENVIVLPLVFVVILFMTLSAFLIHDRTTLESAVRRGTTYAAHCIADPNYSTLVGYSGELDYSRIIQNSDFSSIGKNVKAYRYITGGPSIKDDVETEVKKIIQKTRVNWISQENITVECIQENKIIYQNVTVVARATYALPKWLDLFGMETQYTIEAEAKLAAVDPDEFIRNADLVVDLIAQVDEATGGHLEKVTEKISDIAAKLLEWVNL